MSLWVSQALVLILVGLTRASLVSWWVGRRPGGLTTGFYFMWVFILQKARQKMEASIARGGPGSELAHHHFPGVFRPKCQEASPDSGGEEIDPASLWEGLKGPIAKGVFTWRCEQSGTFAISLRPMEYGCWESAPS